MPLIDLQKSSNTVALVESFLGEFKPDDDGSTESETANKSDVKMIDETKEDPVDDSLPPKELFTNDSQISSRLEDKVPNELKVTQTDTIDDCSPVNICNSPTKDAIKEFIAPILDPPPPPPPTLPAPSPPMSSPPPPLPTPPVKRKVRQF